MEEKELTSSEYQKVIEAMSEQIQWLMVEMAAMLCDISRYLDEDEKANIQNLQAVDFVRPLLKSEWYQLYTECELEGYDPLTDKDFIVEINDYLMDDDRNLFYPSFYCRKHLRGIA